MQFKGKLMSQNWENSKKSNFRAQFSPVWTKFGPQKAFVKILPLLDVLHCRKLSFYAISQKFNKPNFLQDMAGKKYNLGPDFGLFASQKIICEFYLCEMLEIVASYYCMKFQVKLMI